MKTKPIQRGDIFIVDLEPAKDSEIQKERLCVVVSPNEINLEVDYIIILPITIDTHQYSFRIPCELKDKNSNIKKCNIIVDQIRTINKSRIKKHVCALDSKILNNVLETLQEMFVI